MEWSSDFAYAVGLITTDGNLSRDGRHLELTSKDLEQIENFKRILKLTNKTGTKFSGRNKIDSYYRVQFGNVKLYRYLLSIGLYPNKTKTIGKIAVPDKYFIDFLRGHLDGDGYTYSYWDKRWKASFMLYTGFVSASKPHLEWIQAKILDLYGIKGKIKFTGIYQLMYAKRSSLALLKKVYYDDNLICLKRKKFKIEKALGIIRDQAGVLKLVYRHV